MTNDTKELLGGLAVAYTGLAFLWGMMAGGHGFCTYDSILSRVNISYVAGCQLTKPRFREGESASK